jgi:hypothetical protein
MLTRVCHVNLIGETFTSLIIMYPNLQYLKYKTSRMKLHEAKDICEDVTLYTFQVLCEGYTNFPKIGKPPQNPRHQKGDMRQVPC